MFEFSKAGLAADTLKRTSLLAELRKAIVVGDGLVDYYDVDQWTRSTVTEGSATVAARLAEELGGCIRLSCVVTEIAVHPDRVNVVLSLAVRWSPQPTSSAPFRWHRCDGS